MRIQQQVLSEPTGVPVPNLGVRVRRKSDGVTLATVTTDDDGFALIQGDGHYAPFYLQTTNQVGGPRLWRSDDTIAAGAISPAEVVYALRAFGDGDISNFLNNLAPSVASTTVSLATGGALVAGYPVINYTADTFSITRPSSGTRVDRLVARVYCEAHADHGLAEFAILAGTVDAGTPALTQTTSVYEVSLATVTVPSSGTLTLVDDRQVVLASITSRRGPVTGVARSSSVSTSDTSGVSLLSLDLALTESATYDIEAEFAGYQSSATSETYPWEHTYGSYGSSSEQFSSPHDIAFSPDGTKVYVADYANNRLIYLTYAAGVLTWVTSVSTPQVTGVCTDVSGNVYTIHHAGGVGVISKWSASLSLTTQATTAAVRASIYGIATDSTYLYVTVPGTGELIRLLCSTLGGSAAQLGYGPLYGIEYLAGTLYVTKSDGWVHGFSPTTLTVSTTLVVADGVGKFGIGTDGTDLYVSSDPGLVTKMSTSGATVATFGTYGSGSGQFNAPRGVTVNPAGDIWIADATNNRLQRFASGTVLGGYGDVAVSIDANLSAYIGMGAINGTIGNAHTRSVAGPATVTVAAYGKATADTVVFNGCVLSARAVPRL